MPALCHLLLPHELRIDSLREVFEEGVMSADFSDLASLHDYDLICISYGGETMCDNYGGNITPKLLSYLIDRSLYLFLVGFVKC
jgi:hypothetical protein